jgi:energy-coupling factor transport system substrate-specific component
LLISIPFLLKISLAKKFAFDVKTALITGLILSVLAPLIGTPITVYLFGGLAGGTLDIFVGWLAKSGQKIFTAAFIPRVLSNIIDKSVSCIIVALIIQKLPQNIKRELKENE